MRYSGPGRLYKERRARVGPWVLDWVGPDGRRQRKALSTDRRTAEQLRSKLLAARDSQLAGIDILLRELAARHLEDLATRASAQHLKNVKGILAQALAALPEMASEVRPFDLIRYRATLVQAGLSNRTCNHAVSRITAMLRWGARMGLLSRSPVGEIDRLPERERDQRYRRRALTESEISRLLAASEEDDRLCATRRAHGQTYRGNKRTPRIPQTPLWRALIETGARWSELTRCTWADVDLHGRVLVLRASNTKAGKARSIPLLDGLVADFIRLRALHGPADGTGRVFLAPGGVPWGRPTTNPMRIFDRVLERAGIPRVDAQGRKLDIHSLRTTCGSRMARNGVGIVHTQRLLGHSSITLTERHYTDLGLEDIRAAMQGVPGTGSERKGVG